MRGRSTTWFTLLSALLPVAIPVAAKSENIAVIRVPIVSGAPIQFFRLAWPSTRFIVRRIVQDNQGFLWFGAADGLRRYDGYGFMRVPESEDPKRVGFIISESVTKDRAGRIWFGIDDSLGRYDPATGNFRQYRSHPGDSCGALAAAHQISEDLDGLIWLATDDGITALDPVTSKADCYHPRYSDDPTIGARRIISTFVSRDGTLWITSDGGLDAFDRRAGKITRHYPLETRSGGKLGLTVFPATPFQDRSGVIWAGLSSGGDLVSIDPTSGKITVYSFEGAGTGRNASSGVVSIQEDQDGALWLGTNRLGLVKLTPDRDQAVWYQTDSDDPSRLGGDFVVSLFRDREGSFWATTKAGEVYRFEPHAPVFRTYRHEPGNPRSLDDDSVTSAYEEDRNILWIGTERGLNRVDRRTSQVTRFSVPFFRRGVRAIAKDRDGHLWFGTRGSGLVRFDPHSGRYKTYSHVASDRRTLSNNYVGGLLIDRQGTLWVATDFGVNRFDPKTETFRSYAPTPQSPTQYHSIAEEPSGVLWLASSAYGLHRFDPRTGEFTVFQNRPDDPDSLSHNRVYSVFVDRSGTVWAATFRGLDKFNPRDRTFKGYDARSGLPTDTVLGVLEDGNGYLWVSTPDGLSRFDPHKEICRNYHASDGLPTDLFSVLVVAAKSPSGEMFFGSYGGLVAFFPDQVREHESTPPVVLTGFRLFGESAPIGEGPLKQPVWFTNSVELPAGSIFSFDFAALSYIDPARTRYRYRLAALESKWNETDSSRRTVTYTVLPAGDYTFELQARTSRADWSNDGVRLKIRVLPPWYASWWFRSLAALILLACGWAFYRVRVHRLAQDFNVRIEERTRIARELHDTLLQSFQGLMFSLQAARNLLPRRTEEAVRTIEEVIREGDHAIAEGRDAIQGIRAEPPLESKLDHLLGAAGKELAGASFAGGGPPAFEVTVEGAQQPLSPVIQDEVYRIAREILRNAFRHAHASRVEAEVAYDSEFLRLRIRDNGKGIDPKVLQEGARDGHWGLQGVRERAHGIGARFALWSQSGAGTEAELTIPASVAYAAPHVRRPFRLFRFKSRAS